MTALRIKQGAGLTAEPAVHDLVIEITLVAGRYLLGCGTGRGKLRRYFEVDLLGYKFINMERSYNED